MDLQFRKERIPYLRTVVNEAQTQELTQEVRLPDGMPDIGRVLSSWGQVLIRGKEWRSGGVGVNGGVMTWVLYAPEDGSHPQCVETWLPFQMKWDIDAAAQDGVICAMPLLTDVDARSTSARKLMVRAGVGMMLQARNKDEAEVYLPDELPEDICILKNTYPMQLAAEGGEKGFTLEESISLPASVPTPEKLIYYTLIPEATDQKLLTDKLVFRGTATLHIRYLDGDGQLHHWSTEIPFSQYAELERDYTDDAQSCMMIVLTNLELEKGAEESLTLKAGLLGQYTIFEQRDVTVVEDAYSPKRHIAQQTATLHLPAVLDTVSETIHARQPLEEQVGILSDVAFYPAVPRLYHDSDGISGELSGTFRILGEDNEGQLQGMTKQWEDSWSLPAASNIRTEAMLRPMGADGGNGELEADMQLDVRMVADWEMPIITGLEVGEPITADSQRPSLILRRRGDESLWEIAKQAGSTVEAIQKTNNITQEPEKDKLLLIPVL
ncbi:MAG: DUF3794 domain-containing protein [Oscillospiraceae bacterium]|nr:DUF3794 domain-containing protein [Oscillospiraceae bacterium]